MKIAVEGVVGVDEIPPQKHVGNRHPLQSVWQPVFAKLDHLLPNQAVILQHDASNSSEFHARLHLATNDRYHRFHGRLVARVRGHRAYIYLKEVKDGIDTASSEERV
jgi:hypothetical protein